MNNNDGSIFSKLSPVFNEAVELQKRKEFSDREVGLSHPDNNGFIRIADSGEIEIFGAPGVGIVINPNTKSVSIFADSIKFYSKQEDGLRWNEKSFNPASDVYNEPTFVKTSDFVNNPAYYKSSYYLSNIQKIEMDDYDDSVTIMRKTSSGFFEHSPEFSEDPQGLSFEQNRLVQNYALTRSDIEVRLLIDFLKAGYSFNESVKKIEENLNSSLNFSGEENEYGWLNNDLDK